MLQIAVSVTMDVGVVQFYARAIVIILVIRVVRIIRVIIVIKII